MPARSPKIMLLAFAASMAFVTFPRAADDLKADPAAGKKLLAEGDDEADKGKPNEAVLRYKQAFEQILPGMRKIPFKFEVKRDVTAREELRNVILKEIEQDEPAAEFAADEKGMKALGLIPAGFDLKEAMLRVYSEEIAAFYDPKTKTMHLIREPEAKLNKKPGFLERLMGKKGGFDKDENKTVIAHELTHALADQNYDLDAMQKATKGDDDRELALSALIEGEATLTMIGAQMSDWDGSKVSAIPSADLDRTFSFLMPLMPMAGGQALREAPPILSESLLFPYLRGLVFCSRLTNDNGWGGIDAAYKNPPLSTEQILHPEKYLAKPDAPMAVDLGALAPPEGWKELTRNVVGEMQLGVLLRKHGGKSAAAGWDGDSFAAFEGPEKTLGLVWLSTWDDEAEAKEFAVAYARFQTAKLGPDAREPRQVADALRRQAEGGGPAFVVDRRGADVVIVEGFPLTSTGPLVEAAFLAKKAEKTRAASPKAKDTAAPKE